MSVSQRGKLRDRFLRRDKDGYKKYLRVGVTSLGNDNTVTSSVQSNENILPKKTILSDDNKTNREVVEDVIRQEDARGAQETNIQNSSDLENVKLEQKTLLRFGVPDVQSNIEPFKEESLPIYDERDKNDILLCEQRDIIMKKIKNKLKKNLNELDVIESEIYLLNGCQTDSGVSKKVEESRKKLLALIKKAQKIKKQFNIFKENSYLEDIIWLDDSNLVDDISKYKAMATSSSELEGVKNDLELCDEYKSLLLDIERAEEENRALDLKSRERLAHLQEMDHEFDAYQKYSDGFMDVANQMNEFLKKQDGAMEKFQREIGLISSEEVVNYQMKNLDKLLYFNAKYFFGLLLSPFRGLFPSLAYNAFATKKMIDNISKTVHLEEIRRTVYHATDYSRELDYTLYSLNDVGTTLDENINRLASLEAYIKNKFYGYDAYKLDRILKKITKMRKILDNNCYKLEKVKEACYGHIKENERVLKRVKTLNDN